MPVAACTCSTLAPARIACCTTRNRPSCGTDARPNNSSTIMHSWFGSQSNCASRLSSDRSAFCSASVKLRPMAIASPTLFMWVVRVGSAPGNFSNANRGTLTTM